MKESEPDDSAETVDLALRSGAEYRGTPVAAYAQARGRRPDRIAVIGLGTALLDGLHC